MLINRRVELFAPVEEDQKPVARQDLTLYFTDLPSRSSLHRRDFRTLERALGPAFSVALEVDCMGVACRGHACWCDSRRAIAVTLRKHGQVATKARAYTLPELLAPFRRIPEVLCNDLIRPAAVARRGPGMEPNGLIIVCGETGSGKTTLADGILRDLVSRTDGGHNHVIVLGDPIEWKPWHGDCEPPNLPYDGALGRNYPTFGMRLTPRCLGLDTDLRPALKDALRQKPAAVYIEEVRDDEDWKPIMRFAQTGHLTIVTAHANGVESMLAWILEATNAMRSTQMPSMARRIDAIIHVERPGGAPEVWLGERGYAQLGAYGLSALTPAYDLQAAYVARQFMATVI